MGRNRIRAIRMDNGISQKDLAEKIGIDATVLSKYENGQIDPPVKRLNAIAEILGVSVDKLLNGTDYVEPFLLRRAEMVRLEADKYYVSKSTFDNAILSYADGVCELCDNKFEPQSDGQSFLQIHYIEWLSEGGKNVPENIVALCPNCHSRIHSTLDLDALMNLKKKAIKHKDIAGIYE